MSEQQELIHGDRRADRRYQLCLNLRFSYRDSGTLHTGIGVTTDLSRGGIRFLTESPLPLGADVELRIEWPILLQDICQLELVMSGTILRSDVGGIVMRTRNFAFQTCGFRSFDAACPPEPTCNLRA